MASKIFINADGGSRGNPGNAGIGIIIRDSSGILKKYKEYIGKGTNNFAEYSALIKALTLASEFTKNEVEIVMDSELVVRQVTGKYEVKSLTLKPLFLEVKELEKLFDSVVYRNVPREDKFQVMADKLVNEALDSLKKI